MKIKEFDEWMQETFSKEFIDEYEYLLQWADDLDETPVDSRAAEVFRERIKEVREIEEENRFLKEELNKRGMLAELFNPHKLTP